MEHNSCACDKCKNMCKMPCWPTPREAERLILAGYERRLMLADTSWAGDAGGLICPAAKGREGKTITWGYSNESRLRAGCVFHQDDGLCEIHHMKPLEGRLAHCTIKMPEEAHERIGKLWNTARGKRVVALWKEAVL